MKVILSLTVIFAFVSLSSAKLQCYHKAPEVPEFADMVGDCIKEMRDQIQMELKASMQYLAMGAHFSKDTVNRMGFANFFFNSASEERQHALKLISYLLMRGELTREVSTLIDKTKIVPDTIIWDDGLAALKDALILETQVTKNIHKVIKVCEEAKKDGEVSNDYHLVDYLTGEFLEEQYKGQRELAGKVSTLEKMKLDHKHLADYMYDKKLLD